MGINPKKCLLAALLDLGVKRVRIMSYWDLHEPKRDKYDFNELDWQIQLAEKHNVAVSLCLGVRQPRWPESHWPTWARELPEQEWQQALVNFIEAVVKRYKSFKCIKSYQLENEALLKTFGQNGNYDRERLKIEFKLVKRIDPSRPVIMSTSDSYGIPFFGPRPDMYAFSIYRYFYDKEDYRHSARPAMFYRCRAVVIRALTGRKVFIHELQMEPWGPVSTSKLSVDEQYKSMNLIKIHEALAFANSTKLLPADMWGLEWWYWLKTKQHDPEIWNFIKKYISQN